MNFAMKVALGAAGVGITGFLVYELLNSNSDSQKIAPGPIDKHGYSKDLQAVQSALVVASSTRRDNGNANAAGSSAGLSASMISTLVSTATDPNEGINRL